MGSIFWLVSYPKSGNTWLRSWLTQYRSDNEQSVHINELDARPIANDRDSFDETIGLESSDLRIEEIENYYPEFIRAIAADNETIFIKLHNAYTYNSCGKPLFPGDVTGGVIYIVRNSLDIVVSFAHHDNTTTDRIIRLMGSDKHGFGIVTERLEDNLPTRMLSWSHHIRSWLDESELNIHIVRYEDMLSAPAATLKGILCFAGLEIDDGKICQTVQSCSFAALQAQEARQGFSEKQPTAKSFFRQGGSGSWKTALDRSQVQRICCQHRRMMERFGYLADVDKLLAGMQDRHREKQFSSTWKTTIL